VQRTEEQKNEMRQDAKAIGALGNGVETCMVCAAPVSEDGLTCTRINARVHTDVSRYYPNPYEWLDQHWYQSGMFHTSAEAHNAPPVTFLIKDFLQREGVTALAAPVRERKSLIALNIVYALCTGEKLFGHFEVVNKPKRVLYLCPEVSLGPFTDRVKKIGLLDYVGWNFFYRTMSAEGHLDLADEDFQMALPCSVVFLDTAIRFLEGDENSSKDVRAFADKIFSLLKNGAESVVLIHHSPKDMGDRMTLESAMRGSGDMGAFLACCYGTRLQDPTHPYESLSYVENLKQRDFESKPFELKCGEDCRMNYVQNEGGVTLQTRRGNPSNKDGKDQAAEAIVKANPGMSLRELEDQLTTSGIKRGRNWICKARARLNAESGKSGVKIGE
jgi:RecA-family ATPase